MDPNTINTQTHLSASQYRRQFAQLTAAGRSMDLKSPEAREAVAAQMVSEMAFKPMLAEMRKFPLGNEMFSGGRGEEVFGERLDEQLADIVAGQSGGLTREIAGHLIPPGESTPLDTAAADSASAPETAWWQHLPQRLATPTTGEPS